MKVKAVRMRGTPGSVGSRIGLGIASIDVDVGMGMGSGMVRHVNKNKYMKWEVGKHWWIKMNYHNRNCGNTSKMEWGQKWNQMSNGRQWKREWMPIRK